MKPTDFPLSNLNMTAPKGMADCSTLPTFYDEPNGRPQRTSCWVASWRERMGILWHGRVWLTVVGSGHPPVALTVIRNYVVPAYQCHVPHSETKPDVGDVLRVSELEDGYRLHQVTDVTSDGRNWVFRSIRLPWWKRIIPRWNVRTIRREA